MGPTWLTTSLLLLILFVGGAHCATFRYTPSDKSSPYIIMDAVFTVEIHALRYARTIATDFHTSEDETIDIDGSCGASVAILNLTFGRGGVTWSFIFRLKGDVVTLDRLIQLVPKNIFASYVTNISDPITFHDRNTIDLSFKNQSYYCKSKTESDYLPIKPVPGATTFSIRAEMKHVRAQAFGVKGGRFSRSARCHKDVANATTVPSTTTTIATTTTEVTPTGAPDNHFYIYDPQKTTLCIALAGRIDVDIRYEFNTTNGTSGKRTRSFPVPSNATAHGNCKLQGGVENIVIEFFKPSWTLEFIFKEKTRRSNSTPPDSSSGKPQSKLDYRIESINLVYVNDKTHFPDSVLKDGETVRESSTGEESQYPHKSKGEGHYTCTSVVKLKINKNAAITTQEFMFKAFNENHHRQFEGSSSKCSADITDDTLRAAIIVSTVIGIIVIIIIVIVVVTIVGRRGRRRRNYKPIKDTGVFVYH